MEALTTKKLNLIDVMVLVAATATGMALGRATTHVSISSVQSIVMSYSVCLATTWTLGILVLDLARYFTTRRELASRPGFSALVAVLLVQAGEVIQFAINELFFVHRDHAILVPWPDRLGHLLDFETAVSQGSMAGAVAAVWLVTALAGCWRPEKTWIDRAGRCLGVFWLLAAFVVCLSDWAFPAPVPPGTNIPLTPPPPPPIFPDPSIPPSP
jgi:hypothetical protein